MPEDSLHKQHINASFKQPRGKRSSEIVWTEHPNTRANHLSADDASYCLGREPSWL
jgi:hypothetical protein